MARLVARTDAGGTTQYLYGNPAVPFMVTHSRAPDNTLTTYFYNEAGLLMALERNGIVYYVAVDQVGSPRVIYDSFGIIKTMSYSSFGVLQNDSNPGFDLAIGFAGGITDLDTGLVRFGMRDYDPISSRWLARDPVMFTGGPNLYMYSGNNPVLKRDPSGLACVGGEAYAGIGGGIELCYKDGQWSYCSEVGFGAGSSLNLNPFGDVAGPADSLFVKAELVAQLGPLGLGGTLQANDCGTSLKEKCGTFLVECSGKVKAGVDDLLSDKKVSDAFSDFAGKRTAADGSWKGGLSAKVKAGACLGSKLL
jgi:RHS repeat-associated protein